MPQQGSIAFDMIKKRHFTSCLLALLGLSFCAATAAARTDECDVSEAAFWAGWNQKMLAGLTASALFADSGSPLGVQQIEEKINPASGREKAAFLLLQGKAHLDGARRKPQPGSKESDPAIAKKKFEEALSQPKLPEGMRRLVLTNLARLEYLAKRPSAVIGILEPLASDACGTLSASARYWLADSYAQAGREADALRQAELAVSETAKPAVDWLELDMELLCGAGDLQGCADRLIRIARHPRPNEENADWLNQFASILANKPASLPLMQTARSEGLFDENWRIKLHKPVPDPVPIKGLAPEYPRQAAKDGVQGFVDLDFSVGADGKVTDVSIDWAVPPRVFDGAAIKAARQWVFAPRLADGKPAPWTGTIRIDFTFAE